MSAAPDMSGGDNAKAIAVAQMRSYIERVERLEAEKSELAEDIKQVYLEAKAMGYDTKMLRQMVKERKMDAVKREEFYSIEHLYRSALFKETMDMLEEQDLV